MCGKSLHVLLKPFSTVITYKPYETINLDGCQFLKFYLSTLRIYLNIVWKSPIEHLFVKLESGRVKMFSLTWTSTLYSMVKWFPKCFGFVMHPLMSVKKKTHTHTHKTQPVALWLSWLSKAKQNKHNVSSFGSMCNPRWAHWALGVHMYSICLKKEFTRNYHFLFMYDYWKTFRLCLLIIM